MAGADYDLLIKAGRVFCADTGLDSPGAVAVCGDRIEASGPEVEGAAAQTLNFPEALLLPGLVDLHAHPARGGSRYGVDPDIHFLTRGVTTVLSQGDAGARNWPAYHEQVIRKCRTRVLLAINLSRVGESNPKYNLERIEEADVDECVAAIEDGGEAIWGIAFNTGPHNPVEPHEVMARGLAAAERSGKPILFGSRQRSDWPLAGQLPMLRPGDVMTYCFSPCEENILHEDRIKDAVWEARARGVLFDVGHGMASFSFDIAAAALAQGFSPDTISSDQYNRHIGSIPPHDLPRTMSKLIAIGMPDMEAFARVTVRPAELLGRKGEIGTLAPGACADLAVLRWNEAALPLCDVDGATRPGGCWEPVLTVRAGRVIQ